MIDVIEVSYRVVKVKQQKYRCALWRLHRDCPGPERATEGGRYSLDFAVKVAVDNIDHIPARASGADPEAPRRLTSQTLWIS